MPAAVGAVAAAGHRPEKPHARRADGRRQMQRPGVAGNEHARQPRQLAKILERCLRGHDRGAVRVFDDPLRGCPLGIAAPHHHRLQAVAAVQAVGHSGESLRRPELRSPAGTRIDDGWSSREFLGVQPLLHPQPAHRPVRHVELGHAGGHAQRREQVAVSLHHVGERRGDGVAVGVPGEFSRRGAGVTDPGLRSRQPGDDAALEQALKIDGHIGGEGPELPAEREHLRWRLQPAAGHAKQMIDRGMAGKHVGRSAFDHPADPGIGKRPPRGNGHGHAVEHVADGGELDDDDRAWRLHGGRLRGGKAGRIVGGSRGTQGQFPRGHDRGQRAARSQRTASDTA